MAFWDQWVKPKEPPPVDRTARQLISGKPVPPDESHKKLKPNGMQEDYIVLTPEERDKGFVRPLRQVYTHKTCGQDTRMSLAIAETYARDPYFYSGTFCCTCGLHLPLKEFVWKGTNQNVGS